MCSNAKRGNARTTRGKIDDEGSELVREYETDSGMFIFGFRRIDDKKGLGWFGGGRFEEVTGSRLPGVLQ